MIWRLQWRGLGRPVRHSWTPIRPPKQRLRTAFLTDERIHGGKVKRSALLVKDRAGGADRMQTA